LEESGESQNFRKGNQAPKNGKSRKFSPLKKGRSAGGGWGGGGKGESAAGEREKKNDIRVREEKKKIREKNTFKKI